MTLAEIRQRLEGELALKLLEGALPSVARIFVRTRIGRRLVVQHIKPRARVLWDDRLMIVERVDADTVLFETPREAATTEVFVAAIFAGQVRDE